MTETEMSHLTKAVAEFAFKHLVIKQPSSVKEFVEEIRKLQHFRKSRLA